MSFILTILICIIFLALYGLGNLGIAAMFDNDHKEGCGAIGFYMVVFVVLLLIVYGLRACVS